MATTGLPEEDDLNPELFEEEFVPFITGNVDVVASLTLMIIFNTEHFSQKNGQKSWKKENKIFQYSINALEIG